MLLLAEVSELISLYQVQIQLLMAFLWRRPIFKPFGA